MGRCDTRTQPCSRRQLQDDRTYLSLPYSGKVGKCRLPFVEVKLEAKEQMTENV